MSIDRHKYRAFVFEDFAFDPATRVLTLRYDLDNDVHFTETFKFDFDYVQYDQAMLDRALLNLFIMAGVSYYKTFLPPKIIIRQGELSFTTAAFFGETYERGLGEFFYVNGLDPRSAVSFPHSVLEATPLATQRPKGGLLVGIGGGKDSLVTAELLRRSGSDIATWSVNHRQQLTPLVQQMGLPHFWVEREWDKQLLEHNTRGGLNGHVPISAIYACAGVVTAVLSGFQDVVVSNEQSANEPTLHYQGVAINHQYSKSQAFEKNFQAVLKREFGDAVRYYSFLRPLSELRIAELFAHIGFERYKHVFSSCNRAFTHDSPGMFWDAVCPKCAFVFLALTPFVNRAELEELFGGKNLLLDPELIPVYRQLLGIEGDKPLECVGEIKESRAAMRMAMQYYPQLANQYVFELPSYYDFRQWGGSSMPPELLERLKKTTAQL